MAGQLLRNCTLWKGPTLEKFMKICSTEKDLYQRGLCGSVSHWRDPTMEQRKNVRSPAPEEEGVPETMCDELTTASIPHLPMLLGGSRQRKV